MHWWRVYSVYSYYFLTLSFGFDLEHNRLEEGDPCISGSFYIGEICTSLPDCPRAVHQLRKFAQHSLAVCAFDRPVEIVCCAPRPSFQACTHYSYVATNTISTGVAPYVAGGTAVESREYPHVVALGFYSSEDKMYHFSCGGTLISNKYVVTAAHCIVNPAMIRLKVVRMGTVAVPSETRTLDEAVDRAVKRVVVHPDYKHVKKLNDIALVELEREVGFTKTVFPACLYGSQRGVPPRMQVAGWGLVNATSGQSSTLQKASVSPISIEECATRFGRVGKSVNGSQICAQDNTSDTCPGDSGGPLQTKIGNTFYVVGVTSYGIQFSCTGGLPTVYVRISDYLDWIESVVWPF